jgi:4-hydroxy-4-methyl-2-oxoglutarate aldolase
LSSILFCVIGDRCFTGAVRRNARFQGNGLDLTSFVTSQLRYNRRVMAIDLQRLAQFDTPTISNTIEVFEVRPRSAGYMDARIRACFPEMPPMVGYASTATMRCAEPRAAGDVYGSLDEQVARFAELPGSAVVVFEDLDDPPVGATFGEIMCTTYKSFGAAGLITSGPARDLDQVRRLGFPVFSNAAVCSHGYSHIVDLHGTVRVGGLTIRAGDLIHADANGVCSIPAAIAGQIADAAAEFVAAEAIVLDYLKSGKPDVKAFSEARKAMMDAIAALSRRVRSKAGAA